MGVLNVTPDSFSDGGVFFTPEKAVERALQMVDEGVAIIDVGGESTRPGAEPVSVDEELDRVIPVIEALNGLLPVPLSIDSRRPKVMQAAVQAGAGLINDVNALQQPGAVEAAARLGVPVCLMHMQGEPESMQDSPGYDEPVTEIRDFLLARADACMDAGISRESILIDPGFGFGKTVEHNLKLLRELERFVDTGFPVLVGLSRKSMIGKLLDLPVERRLQPSIALAVIAAWKGAAVIRCHDVRETREAVDMCSAVR